MNQNYKLQRLIETYLETNGKVKNEFLIGLLLSSKIKTRDKELLILLYLINSRTDFNSGNSEEVIKITLSDIESLGIALKQTTSIVFRKLHRLKVIEWNKKDHVVKLNYGWVKDEIQLMDGKRLEAFYKLLLKQI